MSCCYHEHVAPAGKYRLAVSVYDTAPAESGSVPAADRVVDFDFDLAEAAASLNVAVGK